MSVCIMSSAIWFDDNNTGFQAGVINGNVDVTFNQAPGKLRNCPRAEGVRTSTNNSPALERPETPPSPSIFIPFARDTDFVERGTTLDQLLQKCAASDARVSLVGLGGVG
jgi:hypothetical protein